MANSPLGYGLPRPCPLCGRAVCRVPSTGQMMNHKQPSLDFPPGQDGLPSKPRRTGAWCSAGGFTDEEAIAE